MFGDGSGDSQGCRAVRPQKKKKSAVQAGKKTGYGKKHASNRHEKTAANVDIFEEKPLKTDRVIPTVMNKNGIRNGHRRDMAVDYFRMGKEP